MATTGPKWRPVGLSLFHFGLRFGLVSFGFVSFRFDSIRIGESMKRQETRSQREKERKLLSYGLLLAPEQPIGRATDRPTD